MSTYEKSIVKMMIVLAIMFFVAKMCHAHEIDTTKAVIHHTASPCWTTAKDIDDWHRKRTYIAKDGKEKYWDGIGYHFVIRCDGTIEAGRDIRKQGAHARGRNNRLGIALVGYDSFTDEQITSLKKILSEFKVTDVQRHHKDCPGEGIEIRSLK